MDHQHQAQWLRTGMQEILADLAGAPCSFWACPGVTDEIVPMATCHVCATQIRIKALLTTPPPDPVFEFDVAVSSHDLLRHGVIEADYVNVHVAAPTRNEAALLACDMASIYGMVTGCYDRI